MKRRFKDQILAHVLETCNGQGASKTRVVYAANMNFKTIKPYLTLLARDGLIDVVDGQTVLYRTTSKGLEALGHIKALEELMPGLSDIFGEINK